METVFRASAPVADAGPDLGPLLELPGTWVGNGFNLISRPDQHNNKPFFLELNTTRETLSFTPIGAPIPNRGSGQDDIFFLGVHYLQQISDGVTSGALHLEPGMWLNVPATTDPVAPASVVRMATIPHGDALLAQGSSLVVDGPPVIAPADSTPTFSTGPNVGQKLTGAYLDPFTTTPLPPGIPAGAIADPNVVLTEAISQQKIVETTVLIISTTTDVGGTTGGIQNIPFVVKNANATALSAIFWIEKVQNDDGSTFMQLQYTQQVTLDFLGINWPHIQVATLVKQ
ncbi:heme-binding protein [Kutzneria chonburiensis]|uniref:Heme-binding protein n=1 Tax=Kutzneria chonburiensis TaxID=1483604 RepID=A0ABV6MVF7_9PSEU|nr:heme-binding protein [Kutzneria chonburiensis]